MTNALIGCY